LKLKCGEPLPNDAFKFNLRRFKTGEDQGTLQGGAVQVDSTNPRVESVPKFTISAFETMM
jgi:hypothetical protein